MTQMTIPRIALAFGLIVLALLALAAQTAAMAAEAPRRTMTLTGTGAVTATPDQAVVTIGVVTQEKTAGRALSQNTRSMQAVIDLLKAQGIAEKDIQTANFAVTPRTAYPNNDRNQPPRIVGYAVTNEVRATIRDLDNTGTILDKAVSAGSNRINSIQFAVSKPEPLLDEARRLATRDAIRKAAILAEAAGVTLGPITAISEVTSPSPGPIFQRTMAVAEAAVPIAAGQQTLSTQVSITWTIGD